MSYGTWKLRILLPLQSTQVLKSFKDCKRSLWRSWQEYQRRKGMVWGKALCFSWCGAFDISRGPVCIKGLLEQNIALNPGSQHCTAFPLVWGETDCSKLPGQWSCPDVIVAADVIYQRELMSPLLESATALGKDFHGSICILWGFLPVCYFNLHVSLLPAALSADI